MAPKDNELLARFCGWKLETRKFGKRTGWSYTHDGIYRGPEGIYGWGFHRTKKEAAEHLPDYANSIHYTHTEIEPALVKAGLGVAYSRAVWVILYKQHNGVVHDFDMIHASAEHRAEAALVVIKQHTRRQKEDAE